jgi:hypothetical protein
MKRFLIGAAVCLAAIAAGMSAGPARADYGPGAVYQIELSANIPGRDGGGVWIWLGLNRDSTGDYAGSDCGRGGASPDKGDVTWYYGDADGTPDQAGNWVIIDGVTLNGFGGYPTTITVPRNYGHYRGTIGSYLTLPLPPPLLTTGFTQLQVAP